MKNQLKNRHLLTLLNHKPEEIEYLIDLARALKSDKKAGKEKPQLMGKNIALIFEKTSTRTRCAFEVAAFDQGMHVTFLDPISSQIGHKESISDTARVLGRFYDAIEYRGAGHEIVEQLAQYAGVPVFNGLTKEFHPTQSLADLLTMIEHVDKPINQISFAYVGDANNNVANSLLIIAAKMGMHFKIGAPKEFWPSQSIREQCTAIAQKTGARLDCFEDPNASVEGVDFIYTDVWVSMGEAKEAWAPRIKALMPYQVNKQLMDATNNKNIKFMHCLPAFHNGETIEGQKLIDQFPELAKGIEVTDEVFESAASIVFDQAENRMHAIKAIMVASLA